MAAAKMARRFLVLCFLSACSTAGARSVAPQLSPSGRGTPLCSWTLSPSGLYRNVGSRLCLSAAGIAGGADVYLAQCSGGVTQTWAWVGADADGGLMLIGAADEECLTGVDSATGSPLIISPCVFSPWQQLSSDTDGNGTLALANVPGRAPLYVCSPPGAAQRLRRRRAPPPPPLHRAAMAAAAPSAALSRLPWPSPAVSWWAQPDASWRALLALITQGTRLRAVTSINLYCGLAVAAGGSITGNVSSACAAIIPELHRLGVLPEVCVDGSDIVALRQLWAAPPAPAAAALIAAAAPFGIRGVNFDFEPPNGTIPGVDARAYAAWMAAVCPLLRAAAMRCTADVDDGPMLVEFGVLSPPADRLFDMSTYNKPNLKIWTDYYHYFNNRSVITLDRVGVGLGAWVDVALNGTWPTTPESAAQRLDLITADAVPEIGMFLLMPFNCSIPGGGGSQGECPEPFWWPALEAYIAHAT